MPEAHMRLLNRDSAECDLEQSQKNERDFLSRLLILSIRVQVLKEVGSHHFSI